MRNRFHHLGTLTQEDERSGRTREFAGDGTPFLRVPGLQKLEALRIGNTEIPLEQKRQYPTDGTHTNFETVNEPLVSLQHDAQGAVLLRSVLSNNGMWQSGQPIFVVGDWEDAQAQAAAAAGGAPMSEPQEPAKGKDAKPNEGKGKDAPPVGPQ